MRTTHSWYSNAPRFGLLRSEKAFAQKDIENMINREVPPIVYSARDPTLYAGAHQTPNCLPLLTTAPLSRAQ